MPVLFTFLLASFPAGLVIYWAWSNTLSLMQQYYIMKKQGAEIHLIGNLSRTFKPVAAMGGHVRRRVSGRADAATPSGGAPADKSASGIKPKGKEKRT
jgi:membrane protein insertase Oxa1/YidC/SpoIIIJ